MLKKMMIMAVAGALAGGMATVAQARGGGLGGAGIHIGGSTGMIGAGAGGIRTSPGLAFHPRPPAVSHGTYCNLNPGYLEHPCF
jgi:hypothetical protein